MVLALDAVFRGLRCMECERCEATFCILYTVCYELRHDVMECSYETKAWPMYSLGDVAYKMATADPPCTGESKGRRQFGVCYLVRWVMSLTLAPMCVAATAYIDLRIRT